MTESTEQPVGLRGIHSRSLGHYLCGLGTLHAVTQNWRDVRGWWCDGHFHLAGSGITAGSISQYLLSDDWQPTAFVRWWTDVQKKTTKNRNDLSPLWGARSHEPEARVDVLDAVMVAAQNRVLSPIFGSGGNVGKRDLAKVFSTCCGQTGKGLCEEKQQQGKAATSRRRSKSADGLKVRTKAWLAHTLFGEENVQLPEIEGAGTWFVFANKAFNSGQKWFRSGQISPWAFLLAMEGALMLRGGVHRRFGTGARGYGVFPFMCRSIEPCTSDEVGRRKAEFWAPLWAKPAGLSEVESLFRNGRTEIRGRPASAPHEFAVAAIDAGVDAGVTSFARFELRQTTSSQVFEAVPCEPIEVKNSRTRSRKQLSRLLMPLIQSRWLDRLPREPKDTKQRGKFVGLRGLVESRIIDVSAKSNDPECWRELLLLLSSTQGRIDHNKDLREQCIALPRLSPGWFDQAWPEPSPEIEVARAIASIGNTVVDGAPDPLLVNIHGVELGRGGKPTFPKVRPARAVWHNGRPISLLAEVLRRRLIEANELDFVPLDGSCECGLEAIDLFVGGGAGFDDESVARWVPPFSLINWRHQAALPGGSGTGMPTTGLQALYALFKPLFDAGRMVIDGKPLFPTSENGFRIPRAASLRVLVNVILQNQIDRAVELARRRYLAAGWATLDPLTGIKCDGERLVGALLVPADRRAVAQRFAQHWLLTSLNRK